MQGLEDKALKLRTVLDIRGQLHLCSLQGSIASVEKWQLAKCAKDSYLQQKDNINQAKQYYSTLHGLNYNTHKNIIQVATIHTHQKNSITKS